MSSVSEKLSRIAKFATILLAAILLPSTPAQAAVDFGTPTSVNNNAMSVLNYYELQASVDGSVLVAAAYGYLMRSVDSGTSWAPITSAGIKNWSAVAINDTGTVIVAAEYGGSIWLSTNSGSSFTQLSNGISTGNWYWLDTNASGTIIAASNQSSSVYISTNTGTTWTAKAVSGASSIRTVLLSAAGDRMALLSGTNTTLYISNNTGNTWTAQTAAGSVATSAPTFAFSRDGQRILFMRSGTSYLSKTQDFGATWETLTANISYAISMTASDDLTNIWLGGNGGPSYYSTNSGVNWSSSSTGGSWKNMYINSTGTRWVATISSSGIWTSDGAPGAMTYRSLYAGVSTWYRSAISSDGSVIAATSNNGEIGTSQDGGASWTSLSSLGRNSTWNCLAISGDGNVVYAGGLNTRLYKSTDRGVTFTQLTGTNLPTGSSVLYGCATNNDGSKFAISIGGLGIYYSSNGATSLSLIRSRNMCTGSNEFSLLAMTYDANKFATTCSNNGTYLFTSTNSGSTWETTTLTSTNFFRDIKASADGSVLIAVFGNTTVPQVSRDWGGQWTPVTGLGSTFSNAVSISSDGSMIILGQSTSSGLLYYSTNKGQSFTQVPSSIVGVHNVAAVSGNASKLLVGVDGRFLTTMSVEITYPVASFATLSTNGAAAFRQQVTITATLANAGTDGKVTFFAGGKPISGCVKIPTISLTATCSWKASTRGSVNLSATSYPTDNGYLTGSIALPVTVSNRTSRR